MNWALQVRAASPQSVRQTQRCAAFTIKVTLTLCVCVCVCSGLIHYPVTILLVLLSQSCRRSLPKRNFGQSARVFESQCEPARRGVRGRMWWFFSFHMDADHNPFPPTHTQMWCEQHMLLLTVNTGDTEVKKDKKKRIKVYFKHFL